MNDKIKNIISELLRNESKIQREIFEQAGGLHGSNPYRYANLGRAERADLTLKHLENGCLDKQDQEFIIEILTEAGKKEIIKEL